MADPDIRVFATCESCRWWGAAAESPREGYVFRPCRAHPPRLVSDDDPSGWVWTGPGDWCGEHTLMEDVYLSLEPGYHLPGRTRVEGEE